MLYVYIYICYIYIYICHICPYSIMERKNKDLYWHRGGGSTSPELRILQDKVSEWYFAFSIAHKVTIGFAVIGVINGVFMQARL